MNLTDDNGRPFATVLRAGRVEDNKGEVTFWVAGVLDGVPQNRRTYQNNDRSDFVFAFYIEESNASPYSYTPPRVWGIARSQTANGPEFCVRETPFRPRRARSAHDIYKSGALQILKRWPHLKGRCFVKNAENTAASARDEKGVMSLINDLIKPVGDGVKP